ncbi:hypothetical protein JCGZ_22337 [Jatropha curcas]|uniref:Zinc finger GRF-type domain-containing protein n=1 Tax=Jatropha curcas TaxID=180498 RepID=A0A067LGQ2_JATCU|nr:hypothetical protein JCGZ_22337 [Jatropha curcas]
MSSSSSGAAENGFEGRFVSMNCSWGKKVGIRISETVRNRNRLYYFCQNNVCGSFLGWCKSVDCVQAANSSDFIDSERRQKSFEQDGVDLIDEILHLKSEVRRLIGKVEGVENMVGYLKVVVVACMICILSGVILVTSTFLGTWVRYDGLVSCIFLCYK